MSDVQLNAEHVSRSAFNPATMLLIVAIGSVAFIGMLVLGAYAPDLRSGRNGGAHALSDAATGFSGLVQMQRALGRNAVIVRSVHEFETEDLAVITPEHPAADLDEILEHRGGRTTMIVLPKWSTQADPVRTGWVRINGIVPAGYSEAVVAPGLDISIARVRQKGQPLKAVIPTATTDFGFVAPEISQFMSGDQLVPVITDPKGRMLLGKLRDRQLYLLADPDLLNNHAMGDPRQAAAAVNLLDFLNSTGATSVLFDVTANGLGYSRSPLKLAFDPPFLAVTLTLFAALCLAAWQALARFGYPRRPERALAFGKAALVENSAALIRKAGRETRLGPRYVEAVRERAAAMLNIPPSVRGEALDERLDAIPAPAHFSQLAQAAETARDRDELVSAARGLHHWLKETSG